MTSLSPPNRTLAPLARIARSTACSIVDALADGLTDLARLLDEREYGAEDAADPAEAGWCPDCGVTHEPIPMALRPGLSPEGRLLAAVLGRREPVAEPVPAPAVAPAAEPAWRPGFADEIRESMLIALPDVESDGRPRPLRVMRLRRRDPEFGSGPGWLALWLVDESGEWGSATVPGDLPVRIAAEVPDGVPADLAGGAA